MKTFPCPACRGQYVLERGTTVDVGIGEVQVEADLTCQFCDYGFMIVGSSGHGEWTAFKLTEIVGKRFAHFDSPETREKDDEAFNTLHQHLRKMFTHSL